MKYKANKSNKLFYVLDDHPLDLEAGVPVQIFDLSWIDLKKANQEIRTRITNYLIKKQIEPSKDEVMNIIRIVISNLLEEKFTKLD